jgi:predicted patatin/cPLA2 family phospholipase
MSEENDFREWTENELLEIIDSSLSVLSTLAELIDAEYRTYDDELEDINTVKKNTFRIIFAAQSKLKKYIKEYEQRNNDNKEI